MTKTTKRVVSIAGVLIGALFVLAIGAIVIATAVIDPNAYKPRIAAIAASKGIDLDIPGNLSWSLLPRPAVEVGEMHVADRQRRIAPARIGSARLELRWLSLLRGQLAIDSVAIDGLDVTLGNDLAAAMAAAPVAGGKDTKRARPKPEPAPEEIPPAENKKLSIAIENFSATNSRVALEGDGKPRILDHVDLRGSGFNLNGRPFPLRVTFDYSDPTIPAALGDPLPVFIKTRVSANSSRQTLMLTEAKVTLAPKDRPPLHTDFELSLDADRGELFIDQLAITHGDAVANGQLRLQNLFTAPALLGQLAAEPFNLRKVLTDWGLDLGQIADAHALTSVGFSTNLSAASPSGALSQISVNALELKLDDSRIRGAVTLGLIAPRQLTLALDGDRIQIDRYIADKDSGTGAATAIFAPLAGALAWLDGGNGTVETRWQSIGTHGLQLDDVHLAAMTAGTRVDIGDLSAKLLAGTAKTTALIRLGATPSVDFNSQISGISVAQAAAAFAADAAMDGLLDLALSGTTQGDTSADLRRNLHASGKLHIVQPELKAINLERSYCELTALLGKNESPRDWPPGTRLKDIDSGVRITGDNLALDGYTSGIGNLGVRGDGVIDTAQKTFDMLLIARLAGAKTSDGGCEINSKRLRNRDIPLRCKDSFAAAGTGSCRPDGNTLEVLLQEKVLDSINDKSNAKGKTKDKAVEELLRGLLNRRDSQ
jgi:AsmA protein